MYNGKTAAARWSRNEVIGSAESGDVQFCCEQMVNYLLLFPVIALRFYLTAPHVFSLTHFCYPVFCLSFFLLLLRLCSARSLEFYSVLDIVMLGL